MADITTSGIFSTAWMRIYTTVDTVTDPDGKSKWIYSAFPIKLIDNESAYPLVVINPVDTSLDPLTFTDLKEGPMDVSIEVYTTSAKEIDSISDDIVKAMQTKETDMLTSGIHTMRLAGTSYNHFMRNKSRIHNKVLRYQFDYTWRDF